MAVSTNITESITTIGVEEDTSNSSKLADGLTQIVSSIVTICCLAIVMGIICIIYRLFCKSRSKYHGSEGNGKNKVFFDQFDVNCSQLNIQDEEQKFVNPAAKITSESESCSSNVSSSTVPIGSSVGKLVRCVHGDTRFNVSRVRERSSRSSSLKIRLPKQFVEPRGADGDDDQFAIALIDHRSNTIHNIDLKDCVLVNTHANSVITPTSALFAQRWKDKTRYRRARRPSVDNHINRTKGISRQASCPGSMSTKGFQCESLSSNSGESSPRPEPDVLGNTTLGVSLSSIDETMNKLFDDSR